MKRLFPRYAAFREVRNREFADRQSEKYRNRKHRETARLNDWIAKHPDSPTAKKLIEEDEVPPSEAEQFNPQAELLRRQAAEDRYKLEQRKRDEERKQRDEEILTWACANPDKPEARRYLTKQLEGASERLEHAHTMAEYHKTMMEHALSKDSPEYLLKAGMLSEFEETKERELELVQRIQASLDLVDRGVTES